MTTPSSEALPVDGRHARRVRGRAAVVDAVFALMTELGRRPTVDELAARSGVSTSSIFRYFGSLADLHSEAFERFLERYLPLFVIPRQGEGSLTDRIEGFVASRVALYQEVAAIMSIGRSAMKSDPESSDAIEDSHSALVGQIRQHFAVELAGAVDGPTRLATIETLTSVMAWTSLRGSHGLTPEEIAAAWTDALRRLLAP